MDKLKIVKATVFLLTFCMVFVLCLLVNKTITDNTSKPFEIKIETINNLKIDDFKTNGELALIKTSNMIHIVDIKKGQYNGVISLTGEQ